MVGQGAGMFDQKVKVRLIVYIDVEGKENMSW